MRSTENYNQLYFTFQFFFLEYQINSSKIEIIGFPHICKQNILV